MFFFFQVFLMEHTFRSLTVFLFQFIAFPDMKQLVNDLCSWVPSDRPSFKNVVERLEKDHSGNSYSLVDRMISRLEAHTQNLESLVDAR